MSHLYHRSRTPACPSDLRLDHLLLGELDDEAAGSLRDHLAGCSACTARLTSMQAEREQFGKEHDAWVPVRAGRTRFRLRLWLAVPVVAAASILLVLGLEANRGSLSTTRSKGQSRLEFYIRHRGQVRKGSNGEVVVAGDALRFAYSARTSAYFAVISLDGGGRATVYYPPQSTMIQISAGEDVLLPASTILDQAPGREQIWGLFCRAPLELEPIRAFVEKSRRMPSLPIECQIDATAVEKQQSR